MPKLLFISGTVKRQAISPAGGSSCYKLGGPSDGNDNNTPSPRWGDGGSDLSRLSKGPGSGTGTGSSVTGVAGSQLQAALDMSTEEAGYDVYDLPGTRGVRGERGGGGYGARRKNSCIVSDGLVFFFWGEGCRGIIGCSCCCQGVRNVKCPGVVFVCSLRSVLIVCSMDGSKTTTWRLLLQVGVGCKRVLKRGRFVWSVSFRHGPEPASIFELCLPRLLEATVSLLLVQNDPDLD